MGDSRSTLTEEKVLPADFDPKRPPTPVGQPKAAKSKG